MIPASVNKKFVKIELEPEKGFFNESKYNENNDYDYDINEKENVEFYEYMLEEESISENYIQKPYRNNTFFNYKALDFLIKEEPVVADLDANIYICAFHVNQTGKLPFLQFVMHKFPNHILDDNLVFPCFSYTGNNNILHDCSLKLDEIFISYEKKCDYVYSGYISEKNNFYIFYDLTNFYFQVEELYRNDKTWLVLIDEIINPKKICNFEIHESVSNFFYKNPEFSLLYDKNDSPIETPIVCYNGMNRSKLKFTAIFGMGKSENEGIAGPYYYFTTYQKSIKNGGWSKNETDDVRHGKKIAEESVKYNQGGIIRFAIFLGSVKVALNYPRDEIDKSFYKSQMLKDNLNPIEMQTMRITDYDGKWAEEYDSIYIGNLELDDGRILTEGPLWVVKEYDQQTPLSFHYIDKRMLGNVWDENENYYIN
jgi:hypothetical protein